MAPIDRPNRLEVLTPPDVLPDPRQYDGRYLTPEIERAIKSHWTLDTPAGKSQTAGDVLRRHHGEELSPETVQKNADYIAANGNDKSPWLKPATDADPLVQSVYVERDKSVGHDLQRHEGWRGDLGQHDRALYQRDPAHPSDTEAYLRSNDAYGNGRLHDCWGYATHIPNPTAYAVAYARIREHPLVKEALSEQFDPDDPPDAIRGIPIDEILGPEGHAVIRGYEVVGDNLKDATNAREKWMKAVRAEIKEGSTFEEAFETVRATADENNRVEPQVRRIESFAGGTFSLQFVVDRARGRYDIQTFHASPREDQ